MYMLHVIINKMCLSSTASAPAGPSGGRRPEPYANAYPHPQAYEMRPPQKVWQYEYCTAGGIGGGGTGDEVGQLELVALAPGVPLLLGYVYAPHGHGTPAEKGPDHKTVTVASQTTITLHSPESLTVTNPQRPQADI